MLRKSVIITSNSGRVSNVTVRFAHNVAPYDIAYGKPSRMANSGMTATLFGGYGFLGRYVASMLGAVGSRVYAPFRGCEMEPRVLKPMFDHGQLGLIPFSARDDESIISSIKRSDLVVNFIGKNYETKHLVPTRRSNGKLCRVNFDFEEVNVTIPRKLAKLSKQAGVKTFIHVSALSADLESSSVWSQTKAKGEIAVREEFPEAIIIRPATLFGTEDKFLNKIADLIERQKVYPFLNDGANLIQPVHVNDVAEGIMKIIYDWKKYEGKTFQFAGPAEYSYKEVVEFVADITTRPAYSLDIPVPIAKGMARILGQLINPVITEDEINRMLEDNILLDKPDLLTFETLGIVPASMDAKAFDYLHRFRPGGHFTQVAGYHTDLKL